ncbi:hypothetical protein C0995_016554 [Termitomyces sp. Mi166|nr:hypothetical protein C0995_016554 [Termitomyces sp. Mi166\
MQEATTSTLSTSPETSPNPWSDVIHTDNTKPHTEPLHTPDPSTMDQSIVHGLESVVLSGPTDNRPPQVSQEVLDQFDPLASLEEEAAREAWKSAEAHPPSQPRTPSPKLPALPLKDNVVLSPPGSPQSTGSLASSSFPSFTALARTFAIPSFSRSRPLSMDQAKPVPSPATISATFAAQQDTPRNDVTSTSKLSPQGCPGENDPASPALVSRAQSEIPFDFQSFLDQMKSRSAEPVSKYLRSFLSNFAKRTFTVNDQVKIINDFLNFISGQMRACEPWKNASEIEFDNAMEGMEKLVMNRLYDFTFTPQVALAVPPRPITADDLERDRVLSQRIALFGWIEEQHLDIPESEGSPGFLMFAQQELLKINHYKAPRDKLICILNCCKVIYGLIRHLQAEEGADAFVPILIYVVLKANPDHLLSNVERQRNVEEAIQALPQSDTNSPVTSQTLAMQVPHLTPPTNSHAGEEPAQPLAMSTPTQTLSGDAKRLLQKTGDTISKPLNAIGRIFSEALDGAENKLAYLPGPFAPFELGREYREQGATTPPVQRLAYPEGDRRSGSPAHQVPQTPYSSGGAVFAPPIQTPYKPRVRRVPSMSSFAGLTSPGFAADETPLRLPTHQPLAIGPSHNLLSPVSPRVQSLAGGDAYGQSVSRTPTPNLDLAGMSRQIDAAHEHAAAAARETLVQIFPGVDTEVVELVLEAQGGDLGKSIEALLDMSVGTQRRVVDDERARIAAQTSILESIRDQLKSDKPLSSDELARLRRLARPIERKDDEKTSGKTIGWGEVFFGRKE